MEFRSFRDCWAENCQILVFVPIGFNEFKEINWLNVNDRFEQCVNTNVFEFFNNRSPSYMAEIYHPNSIIGSIFLKLKQPCRKTKQGQNCLSFIGPSTWNKLPDNIKNAKSLNSFKHKIKDHFLKELQKK